MSVRSHRHTRRRADLIPVRAFLADTRGATSHSAGGGAALRRPASMALALTAATSIAFAPMVVSQAPPIHLSVPAVHVADVHLTAVVSDADIKNLVKAVNAGLAQLDATVANVAGMPGQTLAGALSTASSLTDNFWSALVAGSKSNPLLAGLLRALQTVTAGGLSDLAATTTSLNDTVTLTTHQVATLLTSTLSGSAATVLYAVAGVLNNPLSLLSYAGLINAPLTIAGGVVSNGAAAVSQLGAGGISLAGDIVTGATAQVTNLIQATNQLVDGVKGSIDNQQIDALLTIAQAIVTSPLTAAVTVVNGATAALTDAATTVVQVAATALQRVDNIWLGNGVHGGAIQDIISTIAQSPLSPGSYFNVAGEVITGVAQTANQIGNTVVGGLLPLPFTIGATVTSTAAKALNNLADGLAKGTVGALEFVGVPPLLANTVYGLVGAVKVSVSAAAGTMVTALNAVAAMLKTASSLTGVYKPAAAAPTAATALAASSTSAPDAVTTSAATATPATVSPKAAKSGHGAKATSTTPSAVDSSEKPAGGAAKPTSETDPAHAAPADGAVPAKGSTEPSKPASTDTGTTAASTTSSAPAGTTKGSKTASGRTAEPGSGTKETAVKGRHSAAKSGASDAAPSTAGKAGKSGKGDVGGRSSGGHGASDSAGGNGTK